MRSKELPSANKILPMALTIQKMCGIKLRQWNSDENIIVKNTLRVIKMLLFLQ